MTQAEGVYNQRLQNLAVTLDKVILHSAIYISFFIILIFNVDKKNTLHLKHDHRGEMVKTNALGMGLLLTIND